MNELRMYVEHLFEGRVLTSEMIELKEEIYGNLVARYEDYVASGMDAGEALERTRASMTSVDDVIDGSDPAHDASQGACAPHARDASNSEATAAEEPPLVSPSAAGSPSDAPLQASAPTDQVVGVPRKRWPLIAGGIAAAAIVLALASVAIAALMPAGDRGGANQTADATVGTGDAASTATTGSDATNPGAGAQGGAQAGAPTYRDPEDQAEYEATSALDAEITTMGIDQLQTAASGQDVAAFFTGMPLGAYCSQAQYDSGSTSTVQVAYTDVPDAIDGDAVERALLYNAVAALCVYPELSEVTVTVHEQYDDARERDAYVFTRDQLEHAYGIASDNAVTQLNSSLVATADEWDRVRDYVFRENFRERQIDIAERD